MFEVGTQRQRWSSISRILSFLSHRRRRGSHFSKRPTLPAIRKNIERAALFSAEAEKRDLHGLAPSGVCRASGITAGAVVSYTTVSPFLPAEAGRCLFSVTLSVLKRCGS